LVAIKDVAKLAGVSKATVSRVLTGSAPVREGLRRRVLEAIQQLDFRPNINARGLASKRTFAIGIFLPFMVFHFFAEVVRAIDEAAKDTEYALILYVLERPKAGYDEEEEKRSYLKKMVSEGRVDGAIIVSLRMTDQDVEMLKSSDFPFVLLFTFNEMADYVVTDDALGAFLGVRHLAELGHKRIALINGPLRDFYDHSVVSERLAGYQRGVSELKLHQDEQLIQYADFSRQGGYEAMRGLLDLSRRPTAVFAASDIQALGAIKAIEEEGLKIPQDMAIVGYDDIELAEWAGLTTLRQPIAQMSALALERLSEILKKGQDEPQKTVVSPELIIRRTCGYTGYRDHQRDEE